MRTLEQLGISPTPWEFVRRGLFGKDGLPLHDVYGLPLEHYHVGCRGDISFVAKNINRADARLIAAAPDCLMSLCETLVALKNRLPSRPTVYELEIINRAEAAIRKATGESEEGWAK